MKAAIGLLMLCVVAGRAESLPNAPVARSHVFGVTDYGIAAGLLASHVADYTSTEACIHSSTCHEAILPNRLVHDRPAFLAYELGTAGVETFAAYELSKRGHRRLARIVQAVNVAGTALTVTHNYQLASKAQGFKWVGVR